MATLAFPRRQLPALHELAARVLERRGDAARRQTLAYDLLDGFFDVCMRAGLDGMIGELERARSLAIPDGSALAEDPRLRSDLAARLGDRTAFDPRGPRAVRPRQLADCLLAALGLTVADTPARTIELGDDVRQAVAAGIASVVSVALAGPCLRAAIVAMAREHCDPRYAEAFEQIAPLLDERLSVPRQLKLPIDAAQAVQQRIADARTAVLARTANAAIDRAKQAVAVVNAEAAARIDRPITARLTPREVAAQRACDPRLPSVSEAFSRTLLEAFTELLDVSWGPPVATARPYRASETYSLGDHIDHPKFGRGVIQAATAQRIDVEFPDGWHTLIHARS